jgi:tripartite-type tricarboxylate transporter receptor subunit TctC
MGEAGLPGYDLTFWYGFFVPTGTPAEAIRKLHAATNQVLQRPELKQMLAKEGTDAVGSKSPEEFAAFVREDAKVWQQLARDTGAKVD